MSMEIRVQNTSLPPGGLPMGFRPSLRVDTPNPNGYTPLRHANIYMEGESVANRPMASLVPGARGTIIPRATRDGASRGVDHYAPQIVNIDPHIGGGVVVDMANVDAEVVARAVEEANYDLADPGEAAFAAYARIADPNAQRHPDNAAVLMSQQELQTPSRAAPFSQQQQAPVQGTIYQNPYHNQQSYVEPRLAPLQMPGSYVVPRASAGGGQVAEPPSIPYSGQGQPQWQPPPPLPQVQQLRGRQDPRRQQQQPMERQASHQAEAQPYSDYAPQPPIVPASFSAQPQQQMQDEPVRRIRGPLPQNLRSAFQEQPQQAAPQQRREATPLTQVTFELPNGGQFECAYHEVLIEKQNLVLLLDHNHFMQMKYFPPKTDEPLAMCVHGDGVRKPDRLFLCHTTGIRFRHQNFEYCLLLIEEEKDLSGQQVDLQ